MNCHRKFSRPARRITCRWRRCKVFSWAGSAPPFAALTSTSSFTAGAWMSATCRAGRHQVARGHGPLALHGEDRPARHLSVRPVRQPDAGGRPAARLERHHRQADRRRLHAAGPGCLDQTSWCAASPPAGCTAGDIIQNAYGYGLFTGGLGAHYGAEALGATVIPISGGNTDRQIMVMKDFKVTAICCTPSYFLHLIERAAELGVDISELPLRAGVFGAEPWTESMRQHIEAAQRHQGLRHLRAVGDHRPRRGRRMPLPGRAAHFRGPLLPGDHRSGDRPARCPTARRASWCSPR